MYFWPPFSCSVLGSAYDVVDDIRTERHQNDLQDNTMYLKGRNPTKRLQFVITQSGIELVAGFYFLSWDDNCINYEFCK